MANTLHLLSVAMAWAVLSSCGGGSSSGADANIPETENSVTVTVGPALNGNLNVPYVAVTVCVPGSSDCEVIDRVLVDTGSTGLRLFASALTTITLPDATLASNPSQRIAECAQFVSGFTWGAVKQADVKLSAQVASNIPVQLIHVPSSVPSSCSGDLSLALSSTNDIGTKGILGVGHSINDGQYYFVCSGAAYDSTCSATYVGIGGMSLSQQVRNPVASFASNNNGVLLQLPAVPDSGAAKVLGQLIFGVDTQGNNALGNANIVEMNDKTNGFFTTTYAGVSMVNSFIDSGSNGLFFNDSSLLVCSRNAPGFYCPTNTLSKSGIMKLNASSSIAVNFHVMHAGILALNGNTAFATLAGTGSSDTFDWGLPFFFGRNVFVAITGRTVGARRGPFYAFSDNNP